MRVKSEPGIASVRWYAGTSDKGSRLCQAIGHLVIAVLVFFSSPDKTLPSGACSDGLKKQGSRVQLKLRGLRFSQAPGRHISIKVRIGKRLDQSTEADSTCMASNKGDRPSRSALNAGARCLRPQKKSTTHPCATFILQGNRSLLIMDSTQRRCRNRESGEETDGVRVLGTALKNDCQAGRAACNGVREIPINVS